MVLSGYLKVAPRRPDLKAEVEAKNETEDLKRETQKARGKAQTRTANLNRATGNLQEAEAKALRDTQRIMAAEQDRRRTLQAEWASLNDPRRLQILSRQYLSLDYLRASQVLDLRDETTLSIPVLMVPQGDDDAER